jgi:hypothetical protein
MLLASSLETRMMIRIKQPKSSGILLEGRTIMHLINGELLTIIIQEDASF